MAHDVGHRNLLAGISLTKQKYIGLVAGNVLNELRMPSCETIPRHYSKGQASGFIRSRQASTKKKNFSVGSTVVRLYRMDLKAATTFCRSWEAKKSRISEKPKVRRLQLKVFGYSSIDAGGRRRAVEAAGVVLEQEVARNWALAQPTTGYWMAWQCGLQDDKLRVQRQSISGACLFYIYSSFCLLYGGSSMFIRGGVSEHTHTHTQNRIECPGIVELSFSETVNSEYSRRVLFLVEFAYYIMFTL